MQGDEFYRSIGLGTTRPPSPFDELTSSIESATAMLAVHGAFVIDTAEPTVIGVGFKALQVAAEGLTRQLAELAPRVVQTGS